MSLFSALFNPGSVALIGASADPGKDNSRAQRLLQREGFSGRIIPVNPGRAEIMGVPAFADIRAVPGPVDHAFIMVAARDVPAAIAGCVEKGVAVATIFSAGFAEADAAGRARQDEMVATARAGACGCWGPIAWAWSAWPAGCRSPSMQPLRPSHCWRGGLPWCRKAAA